MSGEFRGEPHDAPRDLPRPAPQGEPEPADARAGAPPSTARFLALLAGILLLTALYPLGEWAAWQPWGRGEWLLELWPILASTLLLALAVQFAVMLVFVRTRRRVLEGATLILVFATLSVQALRQADRVCMREARRFEVRSRPLLAALRRYEAAHGAPASLAQLVPDYLPRVPGTGIGVAPDYQLGQGPGGWQVIVPVVPGGGGYQLVYAPRPRVKPGPQDKPVGEWWMIEVAD